MWRFGEDSGTAVLALDRLVGEAIHLEYQDPDTRSAQDAECCLAAL